MLKRRNGFDALKVASEGSSYDELPMLEYGIDPQLHVSHNSIAQPFHLICEDDCVVVTMSGAARIEFKDTNTLWFDVVPGDFVYVPGGTPHRIVPRVPCIQLRFKAPTSRTESVAFYADAADPVLVHTWSLQEMTPQEGYLEACELANAQGALPRIDLGHFRWAELAGQIRQAEAEEIKRFRGDDAREARDGVLLDVGEQRLPLRTNVFAHARDAFAMLTPLFPYSGPGAIVPCAALFGHSEQAPGYFVHYNSVQEVVLYLGAVDSEMPYAGQVRAGPHTHPVGEKAAQSGARPVALLTITQRQSKMGGQTEATIFSCEACDAELYRRDYGAHELPFSSSLPISEELAGMPTISQSGVSAEEYNAGAGAEPCPKCGHKNPVFPTAFWGWRQYLDRSRSVVQALASLNARAQTVGRNPQ